MKTVKHIYKIGKGPSSSHTMGPYKAVRSYMEHHPEARHLYITLYGSLAATGKDLPSLYKETSTGGLAIELNRCGSLTTCNTPSKK